MKKFIKVFSKIVIVLITFGILGGYAYAEYKGYKGEFQQEFVIQIREGLTVVLGVLGGLSIAYNKFIKPISNTLHNSNEIVSNVKNDNESILQVASHINSEHATLISLIHSEINSLENVKNELINKQNEHNTNVDLKLNDFNKKVDLKLDTFSQQINTLLKVVELGFSNSPSLVKNGQANQIKKVIDHGKKE